MKPLTLLLAAGLLLAASLHAAAADAKPLWLGDPDVDPAKADARFRERFAAVSKWEADDLLAAYDRAGKKDPRWDADVREGFRQFGIGFGPDPQIARAGVAANKAAFERALKAGCNDPLVAYMSLRLRLYPPGVPVDDLARLYSIAERNLNDSGYPPIRKFFCAVRTAEAISKGRRAVDGTTGQQFSGHNLPAVSWPQNTDFKSVVQHGLIHFKEVLDDPAIPPGECGDVADDFFAVATSDPIARAEIFVPLEKIFESEEFQQKHRTYTAKLCEGMFWTRYAWDARGGGWSSTVTDEGWRLFGERLNKAAAALEEAWKIDPDETQAPAEMITVCMGQGAERDEMEKWFRRAMNARPNNYDAGRAKVAFLEPKWGGSREAMLEFGHQCLATQAWSTRMPMLLLHVHVRLTNGDVNSEYWRKPEVWKDLRDLYEPYLAANPGDVYDQTSYAIHAYRAQDWKKAHEVFEQVGDKSDEESIGLNKITPERYRDMRRKAGERAGKEES